MSERSYHRATSRSRRSSWTHRAHRESLKFNNKSIHAKRLRGTEVSRLINDTTWLLFSQLSDKRHTWLLLEKWEDSWMKNVIDTMLSCRVSVNSDQWCPLLPTDPFPHNDTDNLAPLIIVLLGSVSHYSMSPESLDHCLSTNPNAFVTDDVTVRKQFCRWKMCKHVFPMGHVALGLPVLGLSDVFAVCLQRCIKLVTATTEGSFNKGFSSSYLYHTYGSLILFGCQLWHSCGDFLSLWIYELFLYFRYTCSCCCLQCRCNHKKKNLSWVGIIFCIHFCCVRAVFYSLNF